MRTLGQRRNVTEDFILPTLLFTSLGGMTWAVRGCSGYGGMAGGLFAGVTWGTAWWFIAREPGPTQSRLYHSGWIILALAVGFAVSGNRGWMQWPTFFEGRLQTNTPKGEFVPIPRSYGFIWLFIAGVPWAGIGACLLAWFAAGRVMRIRDLILRLAIAMGSAFLARIVFDNFPQLILPLYHSLSLKYADLSANPNLRRLINDSRNAIMHLGFYLGCLGFEIARRDWKSTILILTVGLVNGLGWALLQNWTWAKATWPAASFNFWRCWESSAGMSIGLGYGLAYYLVNRRMSDEERSLTPTGLNNAHPDLERFGAYLGLLLGLGVSFKSGLKGWANIYVGNEGYWNIVLWKVIGPVLAIALLALVAWLRLRPTPRGLQGDLFPHAYGLVWGVVITQNVLAQLVTGPWSAWNEVAFSLYYLLLFALSGVIIYYFGCMRAYGVVP